MSSRNLRLILGFAATVAFAGGCASATPIDESMATLQSLSGTYADPSSYPYGEAFGKRVFTFEDGQWTLDFVLALDPELQRPVFRFRTHGDYRVLRPSAAVDEAFDALFFEDAKYLTIETDDPGLIEAFGLASCGLAPGQEHDISMQGCAGWLPVAECNEDHDLLSLTDSGGVRFGVRPRDNNMCTEDRRPTALTPPVVRQ
ncbi:MAG: hypothetical protein AAGF12_17955 [Myxococcota bacterium]